MTLVPPWAETLLTVRGLGRALSSNELAYSSGSGMLDHISRASTMPGASNDREVPALVRIAMGKCTLGVRRDEKNSVFGDKKLHPVPQFPGDDEVVWCWRREWKMGSSGNSGISKTVTPRCGGVSGYQEYSRRIFYPSVNIYHWGAFLGHAGMRIHQCCWLTWPQHLSVSHQGVQNIIVSSYTGSSFEREF